MPELPDIEAYVEALRVRILGHEILGVRVDSPFLLRTVEPPVTSVAGGRIVGVERLGKRVVLEVAPPFTVDRGSEGEQGSEQDGQANEETGGESVFLVIHLMVAGRLHWKKAAAPIPKGSGLAAFDFEDGTLVLTEAGKKRRASLHVLKGREALVGVDPGGIEILSSDLEGFAAALRCDNRTIKRALTDPRVVSGVGNAYSDEILHRARLPPFKTTRSLDESEMGRLFAAATSILGEWAERLKAEARETFPEKVTAFRPEMAVHGRFGRPCPVCSTSVQRIVYAENECHYCPQCQTGGRILADRALSRLLKDDWPSSV